MKKLTAIPFCGVGVGVLRVCGVVCSGFVGEAHLCVWRSDGDGVGVKISDEV